MGDIQIIVGEKDATRIPPYSSQEGIDRLIRKSLEAREFAYCPYSKFRVGAAVETHDGTVFTGQRLILLIYSRENAQLYVTVFGVVYEIWRLSVVPGHVPKSRNIIGRC